ncbi:MAG: hypothetical protein RLZ98_1706 [Pseudomonadota bacterium]|jgi:predicted TPR repeat methyltransferase
MSVACLAGVTLPGEREDPRDPRHSATCRLCAEPVDTLMVDLGVTPLCESFLSASQLDTMEPHYPLSVLVCPSCYLAQLKQYVSVGDIFHEYAYFSSYSTSWVEHAKQYVHQITHRLGLDENSFVVELASNDGYLLQHFLPLAIPVLGIEPAANVAEAARSKGVPTRVEFFGRALARELVAEGKHADLIIGNNVLAQVPDLNDFVGGIAILLSKDGVATLEFPHLLRLIEERQFDTIYHEHFSYFSLITIAKMAARHGLELVDVDEIPTHGGSLRVYLRHAAAAGVVSPRVQSLIERETLFGLTRMETYTDFEMAVRNLKQELLQLLTGLKQQGRSIVGYGAPGKGNTLLNYCGIGPDILDFTVDRNPYKHGRFTPGRRVPIHAPEALEAARPDYVFILPWNLKTEIMAQLDFISSWGGKFIVPVPRPMIVDPTEVAK